MVLFVAGGVVMARGMIGEKLVDARITRQRRRLHRRKPSLPLHLAKERAAKH